MLYVRIKQNDFIESYRLNAFSYIGAQHRRPGRTEADGCAAVTSITVSNTASLLHSLRSLTWEECRSPVASVNRTQTTCSS